MGTHLGNGYFGKATGKRFVIRAIADCSAINNQINDEWLIRDTAGIVKQLGMDPKKFAIDLIEREGGAEKCIKPFSPSIDVKGPYTGSGNDNKWGQKLSEILSGIMQKTTLLSKRNMIELFKPNTLEALRFIPGLILNFYGWG